MNRISASVSAGASLRLVFVFGTLDDSVSPQSRSAALE